MSLYNTEISRGSLMPLESKRIATLLLTKPDEATWKRAIEVTNMLQKNTVGTAVRQSILTECAHHDPAVTDWNDNTKAKIRNGIARVLVEAKYLVDRKSMTLSLRDLHPVVRRYLVERKENFVLDCLERTK